MFIQKRAFTETTDVIDLTALMAWPTVVSRTIPLPNRRARLRLESAIWSGLDDIARKERRPVQELCRDVDATRPSSTPLTSAIRSYVLDYYREAEVR
ncbi:ribbon-helix-helix domain-containing protein [Azospirillum sp. TSO35-2]|uniref:ribbon-helix-helix domain-containing protein n=1 Tax=Azospirillum sp. TSO35-2 TaxID=716796 RepID=UPI001304F64B|nr:ribbon-helix-helix domain-containing protein [Azospirillum sp. TSO35-2]